MFATPDFGHSDLWHAIFANKFILSEGLKSGHLPFWSKDIGTGFPLFAESQIGIFNIYNLVAFKFLDAVTAFDLGYLVIFLMTFSGTYLYCRTINLKKVTSLLAAIFFSLCGIFVTHVPHFNYIQTAAFLPWIFFVTEKFAVTKKLRFGIALAILFSQQIYTGYPQIAVITAVGACAYMLWRYTELKSFKTLISWSLFILLGAVLALPQLVVTLELVRISPGLLDSTYGNFPYPPQHFLSYLNPYIFGDPRVGTYPPPGIDWGIFWESTGYFGALPFVLAVASFFAPKKSSLQKIYIILAIISAILVLGKYTPLFFIEKIPPLSAFRVPARYLLLFTWSMVVLAAILIDKIKSKTLLYTVAVISVIDIAIFAGTYNPTLNSKDFLHPPETAQFLKNYDQDWFRIRAIPPHIEWNEVFMTRGWQNINDFLPFRNALDGNINVYWNFSSVDVYARLIPARQMLWKIMIDSEIASLNDGTYSLSANKIKLMNISGVKYIISPGIIRNANNLNLSQIYKTRSHPTFYIYHNPTAMPHAYLTRNYTVVSYRSAQRTRLVKSAQNSAVVLEEAIDLQKDTDPIKPVRVVKNDNLEVEIELNAPKKSLLVLSDSFYPGWLATIDNVPTKILAANINQRAILVNQGKHQIKFSYHPFSAVLP